MGVVLLIMMVYVGVSVAVADTGMKPEKKPTVPGELSAMGWQGCAKVDWVTVWLLGANWNWTMSPTFALMLLGLYAKVPFALPTFTACTTIWPVEVPVPVEEEAEEVVVAAEGKLVYLALVTGYIWTYREQSQCSERTERRM
jgi:hypothetical protein